MAKTSKTSPALDLSYANAVPVLLRKTDRLHICLVGCGGTGSWLAPSIARLTHEMMGKWKNVIVTFVDPDFVEEGNVPRQNFCYAEIGRPKAETLALRYGAAWGIEINAVIKRFAPSMIPSWGDLTIITGCVDNAAARKSIAETLTSTYPVRDKYNQEPPRVWWLDCGNATESGQVLLGSAAKASDLCGAFALSSQCSTLPSPALQHPELLEPRPEELQGRKLSCAEMAAANAQSLTVNQQVAAIAADYLARLLLAGDLRRFATYFDLGSGSARSKYITPENVAAAVKQTPEKLFAQKG